ncbi:hypothetical protein LRY65_06035 [Candidatus Woesebacteria bacterium]|nr:hypothetical protein [Candidatus Woesebacteria bacterium]MCD8507325.1 hypothetical protein [Candidatus Woesebacteria bacterium]MCD8527719.1 hypothetical protein [Candidatus Woesebacteria bacterium]MCD8546455.1 hypothetical protein [Candidatus Woesebacteria bacterium]
MSISRRTTEQTSPENRGGCWSPRTWLLLLAAAAGGGALVAYVDHVNTTNPNFFPPERNQDTRTTVDATPSVNEALSTWMSAAASENSETNFYLNPDEDETHSLSAEDAGNPITNLDTLIDQYNRLVELYEEDPEQLYEMVPMARFYFGDVVDGDLLNWPAKLSPEEAMSQNFDTIFSSREGRAALESAQTFFENSLSRETIDGEETFVFNQYPGNIDFTSLWIENNDEDGYVRALYKSSDDSTDNFEATQLALYAQYMGYAQQYSETHDLDWTAEQVTQFGFRIGQNYMYGGFDELGNHPNQIVYYLNNGIPTSTGSAVLREAQVRQLISLPDPNGGEREDQPENWDSCPTIVTNEQDQTLAYPTMDGTDGSFMVSNTLPNPEILVDRSGNPFTVDGLIAYFLGDNSVANTRVWYLQSPEGTDDVNSAYELQNLTDENQDIRVLYGQCAPVQFVPATATPAPVEVQPTPAPEQPGPQNTPEPEETPRPRSEKAPNEGREEPDEIPTQVAPPPEATPPGF